MFEMKKISVPRESLDVAKVLAECRLGAHEYGEQMERFLFSDWPYFLYMKLRSLRLWDEQT